MVNRSVVKKSSKAKRSRVSRKSKKPRVSRKSRKSRTKRVKKKKSARKKMRGGELDEQSLKGLLSENYRNLKYDINSRKELADSEQFFIAYAIDNTNLFDQSSDFYKDNTTGNPSKRSFKDNITVQARLPNKELKQVIGKVFSMYKPYGFVIIYTGDKK
jgi:hypothetical protein